MYQYLQKCSILLLEVYISNTYLLMLREKFIFSEDCVNNRLAVYPVSLLWSPCCCNFDCCLAETGGVLVNSTSCLGTSFHSDILGGLVRMRRGWTRRQKLGSNLTNVTRSSSVRIVVVLRNTWHLAHNVHTFSNSDFNFVLSWSLSINLYTLAVSQYSNILK
jgi:hypothetical protein